MQRFDQVNIIFDFFGSCKIIQFMGDQVRLSPPRGVPWVMQTTAALIIYYSILLLYIIIYYYIYLFIIIYYI